MTEGVGILSLGFGSNCMGKSSLLNRLIMPKGANCNHEFFETQDRNVFSNDHIDLFFRTVDESNPDRPIQNNAIFMDIQGLISPCTTDTVRELAFNLSNLVIVHVDF